MALLKGSCKLPCSFFRLTSTWQGAKQVFEGELDIIRQAGTWKTERVITTPQAASIKVLGGDGEILNFCANNYLGLSVSERIVFYLEPTCFVPRLFPSCPAPH